MNVFLQIVWDPIKGIPLGDSFMIHFYSLTWVAAFFIGWKIMERVFKIEGIDKKFMDPFFFHVLIGCIAGARLGEFLFYDPSAFIDRPLEVFFPIAKSPGDSLFGIIDGYKFVGYQGLASHGATIGFLIGSYLFAKRVIKKPVLWVLDRLVLAIPIGGAAIRIGNFINSEIVGKPWDSPLAVEFVQMSAGYGEIVPRHASQIYEAICYVILFFVIWRIYTKTDKKKYQGWMLGFFLICLWVIRFVIEFVKENQGTEAVAESLNMGLNNGQVLSIPFILLGVFLLWGAQRNFFTPKSE